MIDDFVKHACKIKNVVIFSTEILLIEINKMLVDALLEICGFQKHQKFIFWRQLFDKKFRIVVKKGIPKIKLTCCAKNLISLLSMIFFTCSPKMYDLFLIVFTKSSSASFVIPLFHQIFCQNLCLKRTKTTTNSSIGFLK